ncbi:MULTISPECIES: DNA-3-methyladenine glycosylase family protein [Chromobacterium]|uniref:DNA-3-methyladenine glycosylase family protein n=1 Tax=Chromobacterium TaxID=535 RepID=UPI0018880B81|nr:MULTISPECIES: DNA-3-methyladenine glycosylase 2 family protein [Chromobacterium]WON83769.1 3-methyladenine DNA glycosylase 2 [Chromobacterium haemolyticum]
MAEPADSTSLSLSLSLPADFRREDFMAFHRRDAQELSERVTAQSLRKGLLWRGAPACLSMDFDADAVRVGLDADAPPRDGDETVLIGMARRMLGLEQPVADFERAHRGHPQLAALLAARPGLRVPQTATPFEALVWAVTGQQISVHAAISLRRRLMQLVGNRHSGGLLCHPSPYQVAALEPDQLGLAGFSRAKTRTLLELSRQTADGSLPLQGWLDGGAPEEIAARLLAMPGIGPWTVSYALLRGYGWLDGSLHGDVAVRRGLQRLLGKAEAVSPRETEQWLQGFAPWRALVGAHLWAMQTAAGY